MQVCVCARVRACVRACVFACVRACVRACVCVCVCVYPPPVGGRRGGAAQADYPFMPLTMDPVTTRCWHCGAIHGVPAAPGDDAAAAAAAAAAAKPKRCGRCRVARYCGPACQQADWPRHRAECTAPPGGGGGSDGGGGGGGS
jgi:hypothetical protein